VSNGILTAPRAYLTIGGFQVVPIEVAVEMTTYRKSDTFSAHISLDTTPGIDEFFWSAITNTSVQILATNDANQGGYTLMFTGNVDVVDIDFVKRTAHIAGRDLGAALLETKTSEQFQNQTTEQIVQTIASRVGLTANVSVTSNDPVGLVYNTDNVRITDQDVLFNVLTRLAQRNGCIFWINNTTLNFMPESQLSGGEYNITYQPPTPYSVANGSFISLKARRNYVLARNITVQTQSWQLKQKQVINSQFQMNGSVNGNIDYTYRAPNMTKTQADAFTNGRLNDLSSQEKTLEIEMPGDITLTPEMSVVLIGTGTSFDQSYTLSRVSHTISQDGYRMMLSTRNHDTQRKITQISTAKTPGRY
jgi:late control gene D protein (GPD)